MRVAVTGVTGFVGQHTLPLLLAQGWQVAALARNPAKVPGHEQLTVVQGDLDDRAALERLCSGAGAVLHIAGAISAASPEGFTRINVGGTANVIAAARATGVRRFVQVSSLAAREPGLSPYAASKAAAEAELQKQGTAFSTVILRPAAVYGEGDMATLPLIKALLSRVAVVPATPDGKFSLIHVGDLARVCVDAVTSTRSGIVPLGDGGIYRWRDMAAAMRSVFGRPGSLFCIPRGLAMMIGSGGDAFTRLTGKQAMVSRGKMQELYHPDWSVAGWNWPGIEPRPLAEGLASAVLWYQEKGLLPRIPRIDGKIS